MNVNLFICGVFDKSDNFYCKYLHKFAILADFNYTMYMYVCLCAFLILSACFFPHVFILHVHLIYARYSTSLRMSIYVVNILLLYYLSEMFTFGKSTL